SDVSGTGPQRGGGAPQTVPHAVLGWSDDLLAATRASAPTHATRAVHDRIDRTGRVATMHADRHRRDRFRGTVSTTALELPGDGCQRHDEQPALMGVVYAAVAAYTTPIISSVVHAAPTIPHTTLGQQREQRPTPAHDRAVAGVEPQPGIRGTHSNRVGIDIAAQETHSRHREQTPHGYGDLATILVHREHRLVQQRRRRGTPRSEILTSQVRALLRQVGHNPCR